MRGCRPLVSLVLCLWLGPTAAAEPEVVRGITISTHTDGRDWASDSMGPTLTELRDLGATWVAIHPYARIDADGGVRFRELDCDNPPPHIARPIALAHARGLKILIKPHLAYWGSPFRWRGEIEFDSAERWDRFWRDYTRWIVQLAEVAAEADGFAVGTELDRTLGFERSWRELIRQVRQKTQAPLTYAANWTDYERVSFWDALDVIGIQAYFPLTEQADPGEAEIRRGWEGWMARLRPYAEQQSRRVLFTELGYNRSWAAPVTPWLDATDPAEAERVQEACMRAALETAEREPAIAGVFLWKWFPGPRPVGRNFQLATPAMRRLIGGIWRAGPGPPVAPGAEPSGGAGPAGGPR